MYLSDLGFPKDPFYKVEVVGWYVMKQASLVTPKPHHMHFLNLTHVLSSPVPLNMNIKLLPCMPCVVHKYYNMYT